MTTLKFLGHAGAFATLKEGNSNAVLTINNKNLVIDFGIVSDFIWREEWNRHYNEINAIYISHLHGDHCSLERMFFARYFIPHLDKDSNVIKPQLFAHPVVMSEIWDHLKPSMGIYRNEILHLTNFAECHSCSNFEFEGVKFELVKNSHINSSFGSKDAYGLKFQINGTKVYWSSDSANINQKAINEADIVFHDCETFPGFKSKVHAHYTDLLKLPVDSRRKMYMMHYSSKPSNFESSGFAGFIEKGQEFTF
jgi:ribonuclease BN (tRNA processing enzyme)